MAIQRLLTLDRLERADELRRQELRESRKAAQRAAVTAAVDGMTIRLPRPTLETIKDAWITYQKTKVKVIVAAAQLYYKHDPFGPGRALRTYVRIWTRGSTVWKNARESGAGVGNALYQVTGVLAYDESGAMGVYRGIEGEDPVTLRKLNGFERVLDTTLGALQLTTLAVGGAGKVNGFRGKFFVKSKGKQLNASFKSKLDNNPGLFGKPNHTQGSKTPQWVQNSAAQRPGAIHHNPESHWVQIGHNPIRPKKADVDGIKNATGKGNDIIVGSQREAEAVIAQARPGIPWKETYGKPKTKVGKEIHPPDGSGLEMPHIKWRDWTKGKKGGAEGHIYFPGL